MIYPRTKLLQGLLLKEAQKCICYWRATILPIDVGNYLGYHFLAYSLHLQENIMQYYFFIHKWHVP